MWYDRGNTNRVRVKGEVREKRLSKRSEKGGGKELLLDW